MIYVINKPVTSWKDPKLSLSAPYNKTTRGEEEDDGICLQRFQRCNSNQNRNRNSSVMLRETTKNAAINVHIKEK